MILCCDADAAYLVAPKARSRAGGYIYMGNKDNNIQMINAPIMIIATILKMVVGYITVHKNSSPSDKPIL